ncbi:unnamed protein product, partial [Amoebophrya sp. A120]|eukprot:GSA120T00002818001.1
MKRPPPHSRPPRVRRQPQDPNPDDFCIFCCPASPGRPGPQRSSGSKETSASSACGCSAPSFFCACASTVMLLQDHFLGSRSGAGGHLLHTQAMAHAQPVRDSEQDRRKSTSS